MHAIYRNNNVSIFRYEMVDQIHKYDTAIRDKRDLCDLLHHISSVIRYIVGQMKL